MPEPGATKSMADVRAAAKKKAEKLKEKKAAEEKARLLAAGGGEVATTPTTQAEAAESSAAAATTPQESTPDTPALTSDKDTATKTIAEPSETTSTTTIATTAAPNIASLEAKIRDLEQNCVQALSARDDLQLSVDALEKKVATLETLKNELQEESRVLRAELDEHNAAAARRRSSNGGPDDDNLDELEDAGRQKLKTRIRSLEAENEELKRGIWQDRRRDLQPGMDEGGDQLPQQPGRFTDVDLGATSPWRQQAYHQQQHPGQAGQSLGGFFASGINAITGAATGAVGLVGAASGGGGLGGGEDHGFLEDDDSEFDEEEFRKAKEAEGRARIERVREVKRALNGWQGWRLDLVDARRGGGEGMGEVFEL